MGKSGVVSDEERRERLLLLGEIAGEVAHELRNTLAVISASAHLLRTADPAHAEAHREKIERNARIAQTVVDALMALARGERVHADPVKLTTIVTDARHDTAAVRYEDAFPSDLEIAANAILLARALHILYDNAAQAGARTVTTRVSESAGRVVIDVSDDGPGVPESLRASLFQPLITGKSGGTGLGLALARRVARAHGGNIELVPSTSGATFRLTL